MHSTAWPGAGQCVAMQHAADNSNKQQLQQQCVAPAAVQSQPAGFADRQWAVPAAAWHYSLHCSTAVRQRHAAGSYAGTPQLARQHWHWALRCLCWPDSRLSHSSKRPANYR